LQCCFGNDEEWTNCIDEYWFGAFYEPDPGDYGDRSGIFGWPSFDLPGAGAEHHLYAAVVGVDASSNDRSTIQDNLRRMAYRINKWAGFVRGDVNDDNMINALDVAYLDAVVQGLLPVIFPWPGNGDVDMNGYVDPLDVAYLMDYLMGGPAPRGEWRFEFMP
jgi:hypothetical protein